MKFDNSEVKTLLERPYRELCISGWYTHAHTNKRRPEVPTREASRMIYVYVLWMTLKVVYQISLKNMRILPRRRCCENCRMQANANYAGFKIKLQRCFIYNLNRFKLF